MILNKLVIFVVIMNVVSCIMMRRPGGGVYARVGPGPCLTAYQSLASETFKYINFSDSAILRQISSKTKLNFGKGSLICGLISIDPVVLAARHCL